MSTGDREAVEFRRTLRRDATDAENRLWWLLRGRHLGVKFRRQHPVGPYVLDFYCPERRLAIELDGGQHWAPAESSATRAGRRSSRRAGSA